MFEGLEEYSFKVLARHRGNLSHISCEFVSHARVHVKILPVRSDSPQISANLLTDIQHPGAAGTIYAAVTVKSFGDPQNTQLSILEPEAAAFFELVQVGQQREWLLRLKSQFQMLSLNSRIRVTLEAVDTEIASIRNIPSTSRLFLDVALLPRSVFQIRLPQEIQIFVSEIALVNSTVYVINPHLDFHTHNSSFLFSHSTKDNELPFNITETGAVVVTKPIDLEALGTDRVEITFTVADRNNILLSSMVDSKLVIIVLDYNEHDPVISNSGAERSILESFPVGGEVLHIEAHDPDFSATRLSFTLFDEDKLPFNFSTSKVGSLLLKTPLDAETMPAEFHVKVKVSDSGFPFPRSVIVIYVIRILDVNEFSPVFVEKSCDAQLAVTPHGQVQAMAPSGLELGRFFAEDLDREGGVSVRIHLASTTLSKPCFKIDSDTGRLVLICSNVGLPESTVSVYLEATDGSRKSEQLFELKISLEKAGYGRVYSKSCQPSGIYEKVQEQKRKRTNYEYLLTDLTSIDSFFKKHNEIATPILSIPSVIRIPENLPIGAQVLNFAAKFIDPFKGNKIPQLIYGIESLETLLATNTTMVPPYQAFRLRGTSTSDVSVDKEMVLEVAAPIDRETFLAFLYSIRVCVLQDSLGPCASSSTSIIVEDLLDVPPRFVIDETKTSAHTFSVSENEAEGSVIGQVMAVDGDVESKLRFSLGNFKDYFKIHQRTGRISLKKGLDRELLESYLVAVKVTDILDPPPLSSPSELNAMAFNATPDWALDRTATTYIRVNVLDTNDNSPVFIDAYGDLVIPSDLPRGAYVTTLRARDADDGNNALLQYSLFGSEADKLCFDCNLATGVVRISPECKALQPGRTYSLTAWVRDLGTPEPKQTSTEFKVTILGLRVNAYPPRFDAPSGLYQGRLREGAPIGSQVIQIDCNKPLRIGAFDPEGLPVVYTTVGGSGLGTFTVTPDGFIVSTRELDAESTPFYVGYWLEIYAEEDQSLSWAVVATDGTPPRHAVAEVFIQIDDENDNWPMPDAPEYRFHVTESTPPHTIVATVTGEDKDATGHQLHHAIISGDPDGHFIINPSTGQIATSLRPIDRESSFLDAQGQPTDEVNLVITLTDNGYPRRSTQVHAAVVIDDLNDNSPQFLFTGVDCAQEEARGGGGKEVECYHFFYRLGGGGSSDGGSSECFGRVFAVDLDRGANGSVAYEMVQPNTYFSVNSITGQVCLTGVPLMHPSEHVIWVTARDHGSPPRFTAHPTAVYVSFLPPISESALSGDDSIHFLSAPPLNLTVSPRTPPGTVLYQIELASGASPKVNWTFSFVDLSSPTPFAIATLLSHKAVVFLQRWPNTTLVGSFHEVDVVVSFGSLITTRKTNILIEPSVRQPPVFHTSAITTGKQVALNVTDFRLEEEAGESGASGVAIHLAVAESTLVGSVICSLTEPNRNLFEFAIVAAGDNDSFSHFHLSKHSGKLTITRSLDYESHQEHHFLIGLFHPGEVGSRGSHISLVVHVIDVNEFAPLFYPRGHLMASLDTPVGSAVGRVSAFDPDFRGDAETGISYSIISAGGAEFFSVDPESGALLLAKPLWPTQSVLSSFVQWPPTYKLKVAAKDRGDRVNHTMVTISLNVGPGAFSTPLPRFRQATFITKVTENTPAGYIVTVLRNFLETHPLVPIAFQLLNCNDKFAVSTTSGILATLASLDREVQDLYRLQVQVSSLDGLPAKLPHTAEIEVHVLDVNDNSPRLKLLWMTGVIMENASANSPVVDTVSGQPLALRPVDPDAGSAGEVSFRFVGPGAESHAELFAIDSASSTLYQRLGGYESRAAMRRHALLTLEVADHGMPHARTADALVRVHVRLDDDANDSPPYFPSSANPLVASVALPTYEGAEIARFTALDPDINDSVTYYIGEGESSGYFSIDPYTGILRVSSQLATPTAVIQHQFLLRIEARDSDSLHTATHNVSVFIHSPDLSKQRLVIEPAGGLNVTLVEHFSDNGIPRFLGQLHVHNALPNEIFSFELANASIRAFSIDQFSGALYATGDTSASAELDRETSQVVRLRVLVRDRVVTSSGLRQLRYGEGLVNVHLEDINDHVPVFVGLPYHATFCVKEHFQSPKQSKLSELAPSHTLSQLHQACQSNYFKVEASDPDLGRNGALSYQIVSTQPHAEPPLFSIDPISGRMSLIRAVPADWAGRQLVARVRATDGGQRSADAEVMVQLAARLGPRFTRTHYTAVVAESALPGESVTSVVAISASATTLIYRIVSLSLDHTESNVQDNPFFLDYKTGVIRVCAPLDYEKANHYNLLIQALDTTTGNTAHVNVYIDIIDANDERPVFSAPLYKAVVSEAAKIGDVIPLYPPELASDADSGPNGQIQYYLQLLTDDEIKIGQNTLVPDLKIDPISGVVRLSGKLDYEQQPSLTFWIVAVDGGSPPLFGRSIVELSILDANDNTPRFDAESNSENGTGDGADSGASCHRDATVVIDAPTDAFVLRLTASDPDVNDSLVYRLLPSDIDIFRLNATSGVVRWRPPLTSSAEARLAAALLAHEGSGTPRLSFEIEVSDGLHSATCWVEVEVIPSNRHAPRFPVTVQTVLVPEAAQVGSRIALLATALDADVGSFSHLSYHFLDRLPHIPFSLDSTTGEVTLSMPLDREETERYSLTVVASDSGGLSDFMQLEVTVTDINDNAPVIEQTKYEVTLSPSEYTDDTWMHLASANQIHPRGLRLPVRICAHDADSSGGNARVVYRLLPSLSHHVASAATDAPPFVVDAQSGEVLLTRPLPPSSEDFEFFVDACDQPEEGRPLCSEPVGVTIHLTPQELPWRLNLSCSSIPIAEIGYDPNEPIAGCKINSEAERQGGTWSLLGTTASLSAFAIDGATGAIRATRDLDYEAQPSHDILVQYRIAPTDRGLSVPVVAVARVTIKVEDVNDCKPSFQTDSESRISIPENLPSGRRIYQMLAHDCDAADEGLLSYSLRRKSDFVSDFSSLPFLIDSSGWITVAGPIDGETVASYELAVTVVDTSRHTSVAYLTVDVIDLNDTPPEWKLIENSTDDPPSVEIHVPENYLPTDPIFTFSIVDKDTSSNDALLKFYQIGESVQEFTISSSGNVYIRRPLDAESTQTHILQVKAFDGLHETSHPFTLIIHVDDVNDNSPICHNPDRVVNVPESASNGTVLFSLSATDADVLEEYSSLNYRLVEDQTNVDTFRVDNKTGDVTLAWELDYEVRKSYFFRVEARDRGDHFCHYNLQVHVLDVNDNPPVFDHPIEIVSVPENAPIGSLVGKVHATDVDSVDANGLEYSILWPRNSSFSVDRHSGLLRVVQPLDRESLAVHRFVVLVTDGRGLSRVHSTTTSVDVRLVDVNDNPPRFLEPRPTASISEVSPTGTLIMRLTAVSLDEGDNAIVHYRLLETDAPEFSLNATTGELYLTNSLDYEHTPRYFLTIEARDGGTPPLSATTVATISVIDVNDNPPYFIGQDALPTSVNDIVTYTQEPDIGVFSFEVYENSPVGTQIGRITASDPDSGENGRLSFALCEPTRPPETVISPRLRHVGTGLVSAAAPKSAVGRLFEVGEARGEIFLLFSPDREEASLYGFSVCVSDHGQPTLSAVTRVSVSIRDTNDCQPQFERTNYEFYVQVDRNGNVVSTSQSESLDNASHVEGSEILLGHMAVRDWDAAPNAGPFTCKLTGLVASPSIAWDISMPPFSVRAHSVLLTNTAVSTHLVDSSFFRGLETNQTGFCSLYAASTLPLGSKSVIVRAHDNGMTVLHSSVTITVHVSRQSNLPPEIVSSNTTLVVFRDSSGASAFSLKSRFDFDNSMTATKLLKAHDPPLMRVVVRDRTAYDQLFFELLTEPSTAQFVIDQYDGSIHVKSITSRTIKSTVPSAPQKDPSLVWLEPVLPKLPLMAQLNSGEYRLRVRVTNGSLSSNNTMFLKVITVTEEMLESACVLHVADLSPNELFLLHLGEAIQQELARTLLSFSVTGGVDLSDNVFIISVRSSTAFLHRERRSIGGGADLLIAVYDPRERRFIESNRLVHQIHSLQGNLSRAIGHRIHAYNSLCAQKKCDSGSCATRVVLEAQTEGLSVLEVHGASRVSPRFSLVARCRCTTDFGGSYCERPRNVCATTMCSAPRICVPSPRSPRAHYACLCPLPWTGSNCDRLLRLPSDSSEACFSEACFLQREKGPLQFTGGSFAHWQVGNPNEHRIEIAFSIRTRQHSGPLFSVGWSALRALRIHLVNNGNLAVSLVDFAKGMSTSDWLISSHLELSDGQWHRVRFVLFASIIDSSDLRWWVQLTIDGIHVHSKVIDWAPGDTKRQDILLGAELVHGFRPFAEVFYPKEWEATLSKETQDSEWPQFNYSAPPPILRSGFVGCIRDILIDRVKPPYQEGFTSQQAVLSALQNHKLSIGASGEENQEVTGLPVLQAIRIHNLEYYCSAQATYESSCAYAPCLNGGVCVSRRALTFSQLGRGPAAVRSTDFNCSCQPGFVGSLCEEVADPCLLQPCLNGANCEPVSGKSIPYRCICQPGFGGVHCDTLTSRSAAASASSACAHAEALLAAMSSPTPVCYHGTACLDGPSGPTCKCAFGWRGGRCEHDLDECRLASTTFAAAAADDDGTYDYGLNADAFGAATDPLCNPYGSPRGICINLPGSYQCNCSLGYTGRNCQIRNLTPLKPDSNALGLTPMHGYIIAGIFALIFLFAVITVVVLKCCFRRHSSTHFYSVRNAGHSNSSFFSGCDKMMTTGLLRPQQQQVKLLESARMLPDGGDCSVTYSPTRAAPRGSIILGPGRRVPTPDFCRQSSYIVDENGRLVVLRPNSIVGGGTVPGDPLQMVYLGGGASGTTVGCIPAPSTLTRRGYVDCGMPQRVAPITPHHLHHPQQQPSTQQQRPGSSNTMTSDRASLGSGSDHFSVQSSGQRQTQLAPSQVSQPLFYVCPQSAACVRRSQIIYPHQVLASEALTPVFYRPNGSSVGNLSASGRLPPSDHRLGLFGVPKTEVFNQVIPLQAISNGSVRPASLLNFVQGMLPRPASPPAVKSQPYWAESTLSLLPPIPPSTANVVTSIAAVSAVGTRNPRTSLYRKAVHTYASNADLCCSIRLGKQRNSLEVDTAYLSRATPQRPQSVYTPLLHPMGSGEACSSPVIDLGNMNWEQQTGSSVSSAFVMVEPGGLQKLPSLKKSPTASVFQHESFCSSATTLTAPPLQDPPPILPPSQPLICATIRASTPQSKSDGEDAACASSTVKANGLTPRPTPPNVPASNGNSSPQIDQRKTSKSSTSTRKPLLDTSDETPIGTLKKP
ncbi:fat cadherin tumor suppressor [Echinococcus multilocularis]|uniref:Fat cadherin tumor suppressor n=1 Tax=Echinococcus multilocularis TaxID=6211 RepID=A0A068Y805_ECHMU|nr:fat cadherin tumor suppressor [Echinococcus multilocularis]